MNKYPRLPADLADPPKMSTTRTWCKVDGCDNRVKGLGLCQRHYKQWRRHNDPAYRAKVADRQRRRRQRLRQADTPVSVVNRLLVPGHPEAPHQPEESTETTPSTNETEDNHR